MMIRNVCLEDLQDVVDIEHESSSTEEVVGLNDMKERILTILDTFLVAEIDGKICGYVERPVICQHYLANDLFHQAVSNPVNGGFIAVTSLSVVPDFKEQGVGVASLTTTKGLAIAQKRTGITFTCYGNLTSHYKRNDFSDEDGSESTYGGSSWYSMVWESPMIER